MKLLPVELLWKFLPEAVLCSVTQLRRSGWCWGERILRRRSPSRQAECFRGWDVRGPSLTQFHDISLPWDQAAPGGLRSQAAGVFPSLAMVDLSESGAVSPGHNRHGHGSGNNGKKTSKKSRTRRGKRGRRRRNKKNIRNNKTPPPFFPPEVASAL